MSQLTTNIERLSEILSTSGLSMARADIRITPQQASELEELWDLLSWFSTVVIMPVYVNQPGGGTPGSQSGSSGGHSSEEGTSKPAQ